MRLIALTMTLALAIGCSRDADDKSTDTEPSDETTDTESSDDPTDTEDTEPTDDTEDTEPTDDTEDTEDTEPSDDTDDTEDTDDTDVSDTEEEGTRIADVRTGTYSDGDPLELSGVVVTGITDYGFFVQDAGGGANSGIYAYMGYSPLDDYKTLAVGSEVDVTGEYLVYNDLLEIDVDTVVITGTAAVTTDSMTLADLVGNEETYESALIAVTDDLTVATEESYGEWELTDASKNVLRIDDVFYEIPDIEVGGTFAGLAGVLNYTFGDFKLEPRDADDVGAWTAPSE